MKYIVILMVKNEAKIVRRCLESVSFADAFAITDTGSTDDTVNVCNTFLEGRRGRIFVNAFEDFGTSRSQSFVNAVQVYKDLETADITYGILIDADMVFRGKLLDTFDPFDGFMLEQRAGALHYPNVRLVRMDRAWKCIGVTHEYWTCDNSPQPTLMRDAYFDDYNDGGCKSDKFERDERLLKRGLNKQPGNERYLFYYAQTLYCLDKFKEAIVFYKKRAAAGGWHEERAYSCYKIGLCHLRLKNFLKMELYMQRAYEMVKRPEPMYELCKHFRETGHQHKAWDYYTQAMVPNMSNLFREADVYERLAFEKCILAYYVKDPAGPQTSVAYLLKSLPMAEVILRNLKFYARKLGGRQHNVPSLCINGEDYVASSTCPVYIPMANNRICYNLRYVNYKITPNGSYEIPGGTVKTRNSVVESLDDLTAETCYKGLLEEPEVGASIKGFEDIRVFTDAQIKVRFFATVVLDRGIRIACGLYEKNLHDYTILESPDNDTCEKNWAPLNGTDYFVYKWSPFTVMDRTTMSPIVQITKAPPLFQCFRGSSCFRKTATGYRGIVHTVHDHAPRTYLHYVVTLSNDMMPTKVSVPLYFQRLGIEFCVGLTDTHIVYSVNDASVHSVEIPQDLPMIDIQNK
jgi:glycosyltransferase involved in cell wall biosynthesis